MAETSDRHLVQRCMNWRKSHDTSSAPQEVWPWKRPGPGATSHPILPGHVDKDICGHDEVERRCLTSTQDFFEPYISNPTRGDVETLI